MESIIARALEYTLKYWLRSFSRDQFKLSGRTAQLSNLDINGEALHASLGLPPALHVTTARVGKLEITLPSVSYVQMEPIVVQIDKLDLVLEENLDTGIVGSSSSVPSSTTAAKGTGYGYADKIADGMTLEVGTVNLMLETHGCERKQGGATWTPPLASITIRKVLLYTTNENWQVVNLKEARDFSNSNKYIYVFKKLEWESLSIDLLPHPDMFEDACLISNNAEKRRDEDGAKRIFFGGERFLEGISGQAYITVQRTEQNCPLGLEVQLHVTEAICPALSEPGLRALLRFMTGLCVCLSRGDVVPKHGTETAGHSIVSIIVDHIFLCIKDSEFQLELLLQSLHFSRMSVSDRENTRNFSRILVGGFFFRDTFSIPPCALIQPSMDVDVKNYLHDPEFGENFCPAIYPLSNRLWEYDMGVPLICLRSLQVNPSPNPPSFASQTIIDCQPLMINLQEETCLRISSFLADGVVVNPGVILPDFSVNSFIFSLKAFDLTVAIDDKSIANFTRQGTDYLHSSFSGARLHVEDLYFSQSPSLKCKLLNLEKDPVCFCLWESQPIDASQRKWITRASHVSLSLETCNNRREKNDSPACFRTLCRCVDLHEPIFEAAMVTADGSPLLNIPPAEGIVRLGIACEEYLSYTSIEQLFFVLDIYEYFGRVGEKIKNVTKCARNKSNMHTDKKPTKNIPSDTAVSLSVNNLCLKFLEPSTLNIEGVPLVQFVGEGIFFKVSHRTLGGAFVLSTSLQWKIVHIDVLDGEDLDGEVTVQCHNGIEKFSHHKFSVRENGHHSQLRTVFWVDNKMNHVPFLEINTVHVMPYDPHDTECHSLSVSAIISGVRLGGGMKYTEFLLHRFGILGPDGGPGDGLSQGLKRLSTGPLAKLFLTSPVLEDPQVQNGFIEGDGVRGFFEPGVPDDVDVCIELKNWLFALEGNEKSKQGSLQYNCNNSYREERFWHTTFRSLKVTAKTNRMQSTNSRSRFFKEQKYSVDFIKVGVEGLQALKPCFKDDIDKNMRIAQHADKDKDIIGKADHDGVNIEACLAIQENENAEEAKWLLESVKFSVKQPIEAVVTKEELEQLADLCRTEVESMGRITAGILCVLKLEESIGQSAIDQLSNLGSDGLDKVFTPEKLCRRSSIRSSITPCSNTTIDQSSNFGMESAVTSLETEIVNSLAKCSELVSDLKITEASKILEDVKELSQKLETMQLLLTKIRTTL